MKKIVVVLALCACAQGARAAESDCRAIPGAAERLACYAARPKDKPAPVATDASRATYRDPLVEEDARTAAKLKGICRGC